MFAGAGVKGDRVIGPHGRDGRLRRDRLDHKEQPRIENVVSTIYSALGIDSWKEIHGLPWTHLYLRRSVGRERLYPDG